MSSAGGPTSSSRRTGDHDSSSSSPSLSIDRINAALEVAVAQPPQATGTLRVCQATEDEWNAFVDSDEHIVRPNFLEWFADTGEIHIIEFADAPHGNYVCEFVSVLHLPSDMSVHGSKDTWTPRILRGDDGVQTSVMDHAEQHRDPCFLQAFQYLKTFGRSKLRLESHSRGAWHKDNSTTRRYRMGCDARS
ncbi:hypothetical protein GQ600_22015 [Phytophthora cactorum]|nr:hypothetical protein GQ600_22015 [Phytophthora cactorum]